MSELLPCPFCGGEAAFVRNEECGDDGEPHENYGGEWVECAKCRACTNIRFPLKEPVKPLLAEQWNRRTAPASAQTPAGEDWGSHPLSGLHRSRESFDGAADAYEREYWSEQLQRKADADKARGALQPVSYYVADAIGRLQAQQRAAPPAQPSKVVAALQELMDALDAYNAAVRREPASEAGRTQASRKPLRTSTAIFLPPPDPGETMTTDDLQCPCGKKFTRQVALLNHQRSCPVRGRCALCNCPIGEPKGLCGECACEDDGL